MQLCLFIKMTHNGGIQYKTAEFHDEKIEMKIPLSCENCFQKTICNQSNWSFISTELPTNPSNTRVCSKFNLPDKDKSRAKEYKAFLSFIMPDNASVVAISIAQTVICIRPVDYAYRPAAAS